MQRRDWIKATVSMGLAACANSSVAAEDDGVPTRAIDTHTHFYDPTRPQGVPWPPADTPLYRRVLPADWQAVATPLGVTETIVVEASPWVEDNQWVLDLASDNRSIIGLVGNLDPRDADFERNLARFAGNPLFLGIRWRTDLVPLDRDPSQLDVAAKRLADHGLTLDLNGPCDALPAARRLALAVPNLRIVINHLGASGDPQSIHPRWHDHIRDVAACPNVFMKVSALAEQVRGEPGEAPADTEYYLPVLDQLWESFGPDRLIFGSNWPVSDRGAPYETVYRIVADYFTDKGDEAAEKYFWSNSRVAYRWRPRG